MAAGAMESSDMEKGHGFIRPDDGGQDVFVHISARQQLGLPELGNGQAVEFQIEQGWKGTIAASSLKLR